MKVKVSNFWLIVITVMFAVINYSWTTSSRQRVGHARTYSSALPSVTIGKVKAPLAMGSGGDKYKDKENNKHKHNDRI